MTNNQLASILNTQLEKLSFRRDIDFALNICKRLLPDYINFYQNNKWGNPEILKKAIAFCESSSMLSEIDEDELNNYIEELEAVTPDTDDFGDWDGSYALNSACAILELLEYLGDRDKTHIFTISSLITDTIDFKISEEDGQLSKAQLTEHTKIIKELSYQIELTK